MIYVVSALGFLLTVLFILLILPISVKFTYDGKAVLKAYYSGIKIYDTEKPNKEKKKKSEKQKPQDAPKKEDFLKKLKRERGFSGAVEYVSAVIKIAVTVIKGILKHIKITEVDLKLSISGDDAAETATSYGAVCAAVYPVVSLLQAVTYFRAEHIDICADFNGQSSRAYLHCKISTNLLVAIIAEMLKNKNLKKILKECEKL